MEKKTEFKKNPFLLILCITLPVYLFLKYLSPLVAPALAAMLFVAVFGPLLKYVQDKYHIHRRVGAIVLLILAGGFMLLLLWVLISWLVGSLPRLLGNLGDLEEGLNILTGEISGRIGNLIGIDVKYLSGTISKIVSDGFEGLRAKAMPQMLTQSLQYFKNIANFGMFLITFLIATVLLAKDYDEMMNRLLDREDCRIFLEVFCGIIRYIATYIKAQLIIMTLLSLILAFVLGISGIEYGVLWGILAGLLDAMPFIGTGIVMVPLAIAQLCAGHYGKTAICLGFYVVCLFLREFLEPRLIGKKIGVNPLFVLLSLYAGIRLFGAWGIIKGPLGFVIIYQIYLSVTDRGMLKHTP